MPFKSQAQRKYMYKNHPEIAKRWENETNSSKLPKRVGEKKMKSSIMSQRRRRVNSK
jgi:hypothetical protein